MLFGQVPGEVPHKLSVAFSRFVQFGVLVQGLVVSGGHHRLSLLDLKPVHRHLRRTSRRFGRGTSA